MQASNLGELRLILTDEVVYTVLGGILDVCQLLESARQNDVFWGNAVLQNQAHLSLEGGKHTS